MHLILDQSAQSCFLQLKETTKHKKISTQGKLDKVQTTVRKTMEARKPNKPDLSCTTKMIQPELVTVQRSCVENRRPSKVTEIQYPEKQTWQTSQLRRSQFWMWRCRHLSLDAVPDQALLSFSLHSAVHGSEEAVSKVPQVPPRQDPLLPVKGSQEMQTAVGTKSSVVPWNLKVSIKYHCSHQPFQNLHELEVPRPLFPQLVCFSWFTFGSLNSFAK